MSWESVPDGKVLVSRKASPNNNGAYHTRACYLVRESHVTRSIEWAERSRLGECEVCQNGNPSANNDEVNYTSPAREIRSNDN